MLLFSCLDLECNQCASIPKPKEKQEPCPPNRLEIVAVDFQPEVTMRRRRCGAVERI